MCTYKEIPWMYSIQSKYQMLIILFLIKFIYHYHYHHYTLEEEHIHVLWEDKYI